MQLDYSIIDHQFRRKHKLTNNQYLLLDFVYFYSEISDYSICELTRTQLAEEMNITRQTIYVLVQELVQKGFIKVVKNYKLVTTELFNPSFR